MNSQGFQRPGGDIVTLLDLTSRDFQDGEFTPLQAEKTWWLPDQTRRIRPFSLTTQAFPIRGPTSFGQHFVFDIGSTSAGDILFSSVIQIELGHWLNDTTILRLESGNADYRRENQQPIEDPWFYANGLGSILLQKAWLEIGDQTIEEVDGDFLNVASLLMQDINSQFGFANDGIGRRPIATLLKTPVTQPFPTLTRTLFIPLPFFFQRVKLQEALPLLACKEGSVKLHIQFRPFHECVRRLRGRRANCLETPLDKDIELLDLTTEVQIPIIHHTPVSPPLFKSIELITYGANLDGVMRQRVLRDPFEILHRQVKTFHFDEPLKYATNKTTKDKIQVQLPLEVNHPMEEILWFVRRKATANNNEWTNYSATTSVEYHPIYAPLMPLLLNATIQLNGIDLINKEEQWFRQHIALKHKGGVAAYNSYIYGYSFAKTPGEHQPSGTANASRLATVRLTLDVAPPGGIYEQEWEVKVFVITLNWLRFQNGIANKMFTD